MTFSPRWRFNPKQRDCLKTKTYEIGRFYIASVKDVKKIITQKPFVPKPNVVADDE